MILQQRQTVYLELLQSIFRLYKSISTDSIDRQKVRDVIKKMTDIGKWSGFLTKVLQSYSAIMCIYNKFIGEL